MATRSTSANWWHGQFPRSTSRRRLTSTARPGLPWSARLRALELEPSDLAHRPAETQTDPDTGEELILVEADYTKGVYKILDAWQDMVAGTLTVGKANCGKVLHSPLSPSP